MKKIALFFAALLMLVAPVAQAVPQQESLPAGDAWLIRMAFNKTWANLGYSERNTICRGYYIIPGKTVRIIARPSIQSGMFNPWMVKRVIRQQLALKC